MDASGNPGRSTLKKNTMSAACCESADAVHVRCHWVFFFMKTLAVFCLATAPDGEVDYKSSISKIAENKKEKKGFR